MFCSGVITNHVILTAAHCINESAIFAEQQNGETFVVEVDKVWVEQDLATLVSKYRELGKGVRFAKHPPVYGDKVYVLGFPLGSFGLHLTRGNVTSPLVIDEDGQYVVYHDAATHRGNSGGPVLDKHGKLIGITSYIIVEEIMCPRDRCREFYQDTSLYAATHLYAIKSFFGIL